MTDPKATRETSYARSPGTDERPAAELFTEPALRLREQTARLWGAERAIEIVGRTQRLADLLRKLEKIAGYEEPVLILGESGVGKESLAQAIHLLGPRHKKPMVAVNCPQFQEGNLTVSELFGHRRGSFTNAVADRKGCFETADGGVIFLDEIGDLHMNAQVMLLRVLSTGGEFRPLGAETPRRTDVRVVAATNRSLNQLVINEHFRKDLLFRLRYFVLEPPPLRERGDDWLLLLDFYLARLYRRHGIRKRFSEQALGLLGNYSWPGNVRELMGVVTSGYALADGQAIEPRDFVDRLEHGDRPDESRMEDVFRRLRGQSGDFWRLVHEPFLERDLSRRDVRGLVTRGLRETGGSYRHLLELWRLPAESYQRFMDFLRHHRLKPRGMEDDSPPSADAGPGPVAAGAQDPPA